MTSQSTPSAESSPVYRIDDLFKLTLLDGLKVMAGGVELRYQMVTLRETSVADERKAERESERAVNVNGAWKLLVSESNFKHVLNAPGTAAASDTVPAKGYRAETNG